MERQRYHSGLRMTQHACKRAAQRSIQPWMFHLATQFGRVVHVDGADIHYLGRRELERLALPLREKERAEGVTVRLASDGAIITVYRNPAGLARALRRRGHRPRRRHA